MAKYKLSENNSGGSWWLSRADYEAMFAAGWSYEADDYDRERKHDTEPFFIGDDTPYGWRHNTIGEFASIREAVESFEAATGQDFFAEGRNCCGCPFSISAVDGHEYISGNSVERHTVRPW